MNQHTDHTLIPLAEAARRLGLAPGTVRAWAHSGALPATPHRGRRLVRLADLKMVAAAKLADPRGAAVRRARAERAARYEDDEPTAEEVERVVAEQLKNLPPWWAHECRRQHRARGLTIRVVPEAVLFGRGSA